MKNQKGFTIIEIVLVLVILGIIGLVGWRVWEVNMTPVSQEAAIQQTPPIKSAADLDTTAKTLDDTNVVGSSEQQLNAETNF
jgi:prepilin-type N-terminal cleavage/methylation domain-containing protein